MSPEARDAVKHPTMHRTAPTTRDSPAPNSGHVQVEKPYSGIMGIMLLCE